MSNQNTLLTLFESNEVYYELNLLENTIGETSLSTFPASIHSLLVAK